MTPAPLQEIADAVIRRAQRQGSVLPDDVRAELAQAGRPEALWEEVLRLARPALSLRDGRYYYAGRAGAPERPGQDRRRIREAVNRILSRRGTTAGDVERRGEARIDFVEPVRVRTEDGRELTFLSRDLSPAGIRLVGTHRLLGQKVRVLVPGPPGGEPQTFLVRVLWTCVLAEDLVENGGMFLDAPEGLPGA